MTLPKWVSKSKAVLTGCLFMISAVIKYFVSVPDADLHERE